MIYLYMCIPLNTKLIIGLFTGLSDCHMNYTICALAGVSRCKIIGPVKHTWLPWVLYMPPFSPSWYCHSPSVPGPCHWPPCPSGDGDSHTVTGSPLSPVRSCPVHQGPSLDSFSTFLPPSWHLQFKNSHKDIQIFLKAIKTLFRIYESS